MESLQPTHISRAPVFSIADVCSTMSSVIEHLSEKAKSNCSLYEGEIDCPGEKACSAADIIAAVRFFVGLSLHDSVDEEFHIEDFSEYYIKVES